jgi:hypothetical protein
MQALLRILEISYIIGPSFLTGSPMSRLKSLALRQFAAACGDRYSFLKECAEGAALEANVKFTEDGYRVSEELQAG